MKLFMAERSDSRRLLAVCCSEGQQADNFPVDSVTVSRKKSRINERFYQVAQLVAT